MAMQDKEHTMKRSIISTLLVIAITVLLTACSNKDANTIVNKFDGTWVAYVEGEKEDYVSTLTIENLNSHDVIVSNVLYEYKPLFGDHHFNHSNRRVTFSDLNADALIHSDYMLQKEIKLHNEIGKVLNNEIMFQSEKKSTKAKIIYNEKDDTLIWGSIIFNKQSETNSVPSYLSKLQNKIKSTYESLIKRKPTQTIDFLFNDSILDNVN